MSRPSPRFTTTDLRYNFDETGEFEESEAGWPNDAAKWFEPADALESVRAIVAHLEANPRAIAHQDWSMKDLMWELGDEQTELEKASAQGRTFHFCIVM